MAKVLLNLNDDRHNWLDAHAKSTQKFKAVILREALDEYRRNLEKEALTLELSRRALEESA